MLTFVTAGGMTAMVAALPFPSTVAVIVVLPTAMPRVNPELASTVAIAELDDDHAGALPVMSTLFWSRTSTVNVVVAPVSICAKPGSTATLVTTGVTGTTGGFVASPPPPPHATMAVASKDEISLTGKRIS